MPLTLLGFLWAATVAWLMVRAIRQLQAYRVLGPEPAGGAAALPALAVIVPARNEADVIGRCLAGLSAQDYPAERLRLIVVDDGSTDATAAVARQAAERDPRLSVIAAGALPDGWTGKTHACWQGAAEAGAAEWLCFIDADTAASPALLRSAVAEAERASLDLLSLEPQQELGSVWERLVIPAGLFALAFTQDLRRQHRPESGEAVANGQFILVRRALYERSGGHAGVRTAIAEDTMLARAVKAAGGRTAVLGAPALIRTRMYRSLGALWEGLAKNTTETLGGIRQALLVALLGAPLAWAAYAVPLLLAVRLASGPLAAGAVVSLVLASMASLAALGLHIAGTRYLAVPPWYGLMFPLGYSLAALIVLDGLRRERRGAVPWKGRSYAPASARRGIGPV